MLLGRLELAVAKGCKNQDALTIKATQEQQQQQQRISALTRTIDEFEGPPKGRANRA
jgi:hypothetical protein